MFCERLIIVFVVSVLEIAHVSYFFLSADNFFYQLIIYLKITIVKTKSICYKTVHVGH